MAGFREYNFDGLVGPTHNYAGLGSGNLASMASKDRVSSPKAAALEGLAKMKLLAGMGVPQAVLPPQRRPHLGYLRSCGYGSEPRELLENAAKAGDAGRRDLAVASSASAMWAANAATVSPSPDTADGRCHFTIANLASQRHRALESLERLRVFEHLFGDGRYFEVHPPLPATLPDEGAANHGRIGPSHGEPCVEFFVFGRASGETRPTGKFVARHVLGASLKYRRLHNLKVRSPAEPEDTHWSAFRVIPQSDEAIEAGVFHNDVINVANESVLLGHELAWRSREPGYGDHGDVLADLVERYCDSMLHYVKITQREFPLPDAVRSYLFNSQLATLPAGDMALVYPAECDEVPSARAAIDRVLREDNPVQYAVRADVRQSMRNGGGPACLRLRVVLSDEERAAVRGNVFWSEPLHETLVGWVERHYRDALTPGDLADVRLYEESEAALDELGEILELPI